MVPGSGWVDSQQGRSLLHIIKTEPEWRSRRLRPAAPMGSHNPLPSFQTQNLEEKQVPGRKDPATPQRGFRGDSTDFHVFLPFTWGKRGVFRLGV